MSETCVPRGRIRVLLLVAVFCCLQTISAFADSVTTNVSTFENVVGSGNYIDCQSATSCGTSQATGSLATGTAGALAQTSSYLPNFSAGVNFWEAIASSELSYDNTVDVPSGAGSIALSGGNVIFTLALSGSETTSGSDGSAGAEIVIGSGESFVGASGTSLILPTGASTVKISTPVSAGSSAFSFTLFDEATCPGYTALQIALGDSCTATADFLDPATITGAAVYDSNGDLISNASIVSRSGYSPPATTPEPTSVLLFGTGLLGLVGLVRRRPSV
jgi:hypothetical protein